MSPRLSIRPARSLPALCCAALLSAPAVAGSWSDETISGMELEIFTPDAPPQGGRPMMVNLHGCAQDGDLFRERANWEAAAERFGMVVALPTVPNLGQVRKTREAAFEQDA